MGREGLRTLPMAGLAEVRPSFPKQKRKREKGEDVSWNEELSWLLDDKLACFDAERKSIAAAKIDKS